MTRHATLLSGALALAASFAIAAAPAAAHVVHPLQASFTGSATPAGSFTPQGVALDASGDVFVTDSAHHVLDKLSSAGAYLCQITGAGETSASPSECDKTAPGVPGGAFGSAIGQGLFGGEGDLFFPDFSAHAIDRFTAADAYVSQLALPSAGSPLQVAQDASGEHQYVVDSTHHLIDTYNTATATWGTFTTGTPAGGLFTLSSPAGVAVNDDPTSPAFGDLYVADPHNHAVDVYGSDGTYLSDITATPAGALSVGLGKLAVDPTNGDLFIPDTNNHVLDEFAPGGAFVSQTPVPGPGAAPQAVAIGPAAGVLFVADKAAGVIDVFATALIPDVETGSASEISQTTATLGGHIDPAGGGEITHCAFEYGPTTSYTKTAACTPPPPNSTPTSVTAQLTELTPSATYHFRVVAANANGVSSDGEDHTFTVAGAPAIDRQSSRVNGVGAVLTAQINPLHLDTTCQVQYVGDAGFKASGYATATTQACAPEDVGSGLGDVAANVALTRLQVGATYHYRFLTTNPAGPTVGADRTFQTFGVHGATFELLDKEGTPFTQAGGHPYELRTGFAVNWTENVGGEPFPESTHPEELPTGNIRSVLTELPPGLIGNPSAAVRCTRAEVIRFRCSDAAQVGVLNAVEAAGGELTDGIYNLVPPKGVTAEFGANVEQHVTVYIDARLRPNGDYALTAESQNNSAVTGVTDVSVHLWGVPADASHDRQRCSKLPGGECPEAHSAGVTETPLLFNPTSCGGTLTTVLSADSYQAIGLFDKHSIEMPAMIGCGELSFSPTLQVTPTGHVADSPTGLHVDLHIPQQPAIREPASLREADLKDTVVTLPQGLTINPAAAGGLDACSSRQIGLTSATGVSPAVFNEASADCPDASKIGTVEVTTPLLNEEDGEGRVVEEAGLPVPHVLHGAVYIASPYDNPFGSLFAIYVTVEDSKTGVVIKLPGRVEPDANTGQLTTTFLDSPQLPFEDFKLDFFSGPRATLATPESCGSFAASASLTPWSGGAPKTPGVTAFGLSSGCVTGFAPAFSAGTLNPQAGAFSPLTLAFQREDSDQELSGLAVSLPPGLLAKVAGVEKCSESQLAAAAAKSGAEERTNPSCPAGSLIGTVQAGAGAGEEPFYTSGKAYWTGPYKGGPYGVAVIVPALAGPFDLGNVVVRTALHIDPSDGHVTAISDPFPTILKGVPLRVRRVALTIDRSQFSFNPTSCNPMSFTGTLTSTGGLTAPLSQRFQAGGCNGLPFKPRFSASTAGHTSRVNGASLVVKVQQRPGEADIHTVDLQLPLALPARLTTLNKACTEAQFNADPSGCPAASNVGSARAVTPVLNVPLTGPAYLVSHGGAAFPDLEYVLQGEGVKIVLDGKTDIKHGITYSHFETVPDAPISSFETTLPEGPHSILGAIKSFCTLTKTVLVTKTVSRRVHGRLVHVRKRVTKRVTDPLLAPTTITAQNGAVVTQATKIAVTGCSARRATSHTKRRAQSKR
jgi:hypothetical protein